MLFLFIWKLFCNKVLKLSRMTKQLEIQMYRRVKEKKRETLGHRHQKKIPAWHFSVGIRNSHMAKVIISTSLEADMQIIAEVIGKKCFMFYAKHTLNYLLICRYWRCLQNGCSPMHGVFQGILQWGSTNLEEKLMKWRVLWFSEINFL